MTKPLSAGRGFVHEAKLASNVEAMYPSAVDVSTFEINPLQAQNPSDAVSQTFYVQVLFPNCSEPQWALIDTGAQLSLITTTCARFCNLVQEGFSNVVASNLRVGGVNGNPWQTARLETTVILGSQRLASRELPIKFALLGGDRYKIIIGMDILKEKKMTLDLAQEVLRFKLGQDEKINLKLTPRNVVFKTKQLKAYRDYIGTIRGRNNHNNHRRGKVNEV